MTILSWVWSYQQWDMISLETGLRSGDRHGFTPFLSDSTRSVWDKISKLLQQSTRPMTWDKAKIEMNWQRFVFLEIAKSGKPKHSLLWTTLVPPISDCWRTQENGWQSHRDSAIKTAIVLVTMSSHFTWGSSNFLFLFPDHYYPSILSWRSSMFFSTRAWTKITPWK